MGKIIKKPDGVWMRTNYMVMQWGRGQTSWGWGGDNFQYFVTL